MTLNTHPLLPPALLIACSLVPTQCIAQCGTTSGKDDGAAQAEADCDYVCPDAYWGEWDGVHYYSGPYCYGCVANGFYFVSGNATNPLGDSCDANDCESPLRVARLTLPKTAERDEEPIYDSPHLSEITNYVGPRPHGGLPGSGVNARSTYNAGDDAGHDGDEGVGKRKVEDDFVAVLRCREGNVEVRRFFRVLKLQHDAIRDREGNLTSQTRYVAQELNRNFPGDSTNTSAKLRYISKHDPRRGTLELTILNRPVMVECIARHGLPAACVTLD